MLCLHFMNQNFLLIFSHAANLACSKCYKHFWVNGKARRGGYDRQNWTRRTKENHMRRVQKTRAAASETEKKKLESKNGVRDCPLLKLPYFDPIR